VVSNNISHNGFNKKYDILKMLKIAILAFFKNKKL